MFKSSKSNKQTKRPRGDGGADLMKQMGFSIPNFDDPNFGADDDDDDEDLAAELELMDQGASGQTKKRPTDKKKRSDGSTQDLQAFHQDVNKLLSDIDRPINDEDLSDVDEADLLDELKEMTGEIEDEPKPMETKPVQSTSNGGVVSLLETRLEMYKKAVETAKTSGDASKTRRYDRQFKLIQELLQAARAGKPFDESEIPPAIGVAAAPSVQPTNVPREVPFQTASPSPPPEPTIASLPVIDESITPKPPTSMATSNNSDEAIARLKALALQAKAEGDMAKAREHLLQLRSLQGGAGSVSAPPPPQPSLPASAQIDTHTNVPEDENSAAIAIPLIAPVPRTIMEALQQRHEEFVKRHKEAVSKEESSKARRMDRLAKQYQEAMEATRKGQAYDYSELADLPGFAPIPVQQPKPQPPPPSATAAPVKTSQSTAQIRPTQPQRSVPTNGSLPQLASKTSTNIQTNQQVQSLRLKQEQLRRLALQASHQGDKETAKKYLLESRTLEQPIASAESARSIDTNQAIDLPIEDYDAIRDDELTEEISQSSRETIYRRLHEDLLRQMQLCARNQQMYAQMEGPNNIIQAKEFKNLELRCAHDLERLKQCFQHNVKPPLFHYEKRQMNIIRVNNDLTDNDCEVTVLRGINLQVPSGYSAAALETYVIIEFPYPPEALQTARTRNATGSINAEYADSLHKFQIKRNDSKFKRLMTRKDLKLTIFYRAGFLRADRQLGTAFVKLAGLDQSPIIHESVDVYENDHKKKPEGKLEVKIRIKEALGSAKSSEVLLQRWLVIDRFEEISPNSKPSAAKSTSISSSIATIAQLIPTGEALGLLAINLAGNNADSDDVIDSSRPNVVESKGDNRQNNQQQTGVQSIQILKYEADRLEEQIELLEDHLPADQIEQLRVKHQAFKEQSDRIVENLRHGGKQAIQEHARGLEQLLERYKREEEEYRQRNDKKKADLSLHKRNLVVREIETLTGPISPEESMHL